MKGKRFILSAGLMCSGSTLLFNILRVILFQKWGKYLSSGWQNDIRTLPRNKFYLIKAHHIDPYLRMKPRQIFFSYRDLRVIAVSRYKRFNNPYLMTSIDADIEEYQIARRYAHLVKYEDMIGQPLETIGYIAKKLRLPVDPYFIRDAVDKLQLPGNNVQYSKVTLLSPNHITNTNDNEWRDAIPKELQEEINEKYAWWFKACGYPEE
jgi:hypothetical protein